MKPSTKLWILAAGLIILLIIVLKFGGRPVTTERVEADPFPIGSKARLIYQDTERFPAYMSEAFFWNADRAIGCNDRTEIARIILDKEAEMLPAGTEVTVRSYNSRGVAEIELPGGERRRIMIKALHK
jgi:hypothetical protein